MVTADKSAKVSSSQANSVNKTCGISTFIMNIITKMMVLRCISHPQGEEAASTVMAAGIRLVVCPRRARVDHNVPGEATGREQNTGFFFSLY